MTAEPTLIDWREVPLPDTTGLVPHWARQVVAEVFKDCPRGAPSMTWGVNKRQRFSSGYAWGSGYRIHVTEGLRAERWEQMTVLLHECAHQIRGCRPGHDNEFWRVAWTLYRAHDLPLRKVLVREGDLFTKARAGYLATRPSKVAS